MTSLLEHITVGDAFMIANIISLPQECGTVATSF